MTPYSPRKENYTDDVRTQFKTVPYHQAALIELDEVGPGYVTGHMDRAEGMTQQHGYFHAAALVGLADAVAGAAAYSLMDEGEDVLSANFAVSMLRPADTDRVWAEGRVIKTGKRLYVCESKLYTDREHSRLVVAATVTLVAV